MPQLNLTTTLGKLFSHCSLGFLTVPIKEFLNKRMVTVLSQIGVGSSVGTICASKWIDGGEATIGRFKEHRDGFVMEQS